MNQLTVIIPSHEPLSVVEEFLPSICASSSGSFPVSILIVDSRFQPDVQSFCEGIGVKYESASKACRAVQLNYGALHSDGKNLFFLHLDSTLPVNYDLLIEDAFQKGADSGCFRMKFSPSTNFLNFWAYFTRFHWRFARGGDQGLFVKRTALNQMGGYKNWPVMEDIQICHELEKSGVFKIIEEPITTSSRKYERYGQVYLQAVFSALMLLFWVGLKPELLNKIYKRLLNKD